ncbi:MAG: iron dicitrate transport regulator FecR, partial [Planctomycetota bacterium]
AWVSNLPTSQGSKLRRGTLHLKSGIAKLQFHSGAEITLEAPAQLELVSAMRAKLNSGSAVLNVPESATGFILDTPDGYAVDFGTQFAVTIDSVTQQSDFELIEGEIEVHQPRLGKSVRLTSVGQAASLSNDSLDLVEEAAFNELIGESSQTQPRTIRIATEGRCAVALHNERRRKKAIRPGYLYASHTQNGKWDMRSYIGFDVSSVDFDSVASVKLRLNQVQSYRGSAALLPKSNRFAVYGLTTAVDEEPEWDSSPTQEAGVLVGTFELPRSTMRGVVEVGSPELLSFLSRHAKQPITLLLVRETGRIEGTGPAMPHVFASDTHPEAVGPLLELQLKD